MEFVNLHTHSHYSILESNIQPKSLLKKAAAMGHRAVALTDKGVGYGLVEIVEAANKMGDDEKVKPILGAEIFLAKDSRFEKRLGVDGSEASIVLLAKSDKGYHNLLKIISYAQLQGLHQETPRADFELLAEYKEDLICLSGAFNGHVGQTFLRDGAVKALEQVKKLQEIFGENFYLELCGRHFEDQEKVNLWKVDTGRILNIDFVVTSDARFLEDSDEEAVDVLYCIGKNLQVSDPYREKFTERNNFCAWEELVQRLDYLPGDLLEKAREKTLEIADSVDFEMGFGLDLLPQFDVPEGETEKSQLRKLCEEAIPKRYAGQEAVYEAEAYERLDYELSVIERMGFSAYFLIVADFVQYAKDIGIFVGPGRGSAAGSIVAYLMDITNIDPLRYELLFERFLNPERVSMPDIDIDFSDERRDEVLRYVIDKYGAEKVSKVCTFGTLAAKAAMKDVGRAMGVDFALMNNLTKLMPAKPGSTLADAKELKEFTDFLGGNPLCQRVFDIAEKLEGCVRHVSVHACAVIIGKTDLTDDAPIQWAPGTEDTMISQYPYQQLEHLGLLKMDFLGLKNLSIIERALAHIKEHTGEIIDIEQIPLKDEKTFAMLAEGETTGVFQFESAGMRRYLRELKPTDLEDLVAMNALYRPGPMEYIPQYIRGKHDPKTVEYMHPLLEPILNKTYGIAVYQEQVLRIARDLAGFSLGEADILRKAIGKKIASILAEQRAKFIDGGLEKGIERKMGEKLFDEIIVPFSGYGFNRSHAVCYAWIAYQTAYLRANYPVEFMAAQMTNDRNNTDRIVMEMSECTQMKIEVLPPSVNDSGSFFTVVN